MNRVKAKNVQPHSKRKARALNTVDNSLTMLSKKGNLSYVNEIYNPNDFFEEAHHISLYPEDSKIKLENETIKVHVLKKIVDKPLWHPANVLFFFLQFIQIARKNRVSVIRGRSTGLSGFLGVLTGKILGIPFIVSLGQNTKLVRELKTRFKRESLSQLEILKETFTELVEVFVVRNADFIITPSKYLRDYACLLKADGKNITVIPWILKRDVFNGKVDRKELNEFITQFHLDAKKPIVLYVGRLEAEKQVDALFEAIPFVLQKKPDAQFVFIGDGSLKEELEQRATNLNVAKSVYFLGFHPTNVVRAFLSIASVVWIPMSGYVTLEAATYGAPIVAFDVEWHSEFISNEITGLLVENRNYRKMAEAVIRMLKDQAFAEKCGERARQKLVEEYNPEGLKKKEIKIYENILNKFSLQQ